MSDLVASNGVTYFFIYFLKVRPCSVFAGGPESDFLHKLPPKFLDSLNNKVSQLSLAASHAPTNIVILDNCSYSFPKANVADVFIRPRSTAQQDIVGTELLEFKKLVGFHDHEVVDVSARKSLLGVYHRAFLTILALLDLCQ